MEHRWGTRKSAKFDVIVSYPPLGCVRAKGRDMSLQGMFIETGPIALSVNTPVTLTIRQEGSGGDRTYRLCALVVRVVKEGAGLIFKDFDEATLRTLRELAFDDQGDTLLGRKLWLGPVENANSGSGESLNQEHMRRSICDTRKV